MAKDDYDVIVYRVLVYLYACLKGKIMYNELTFKKATQYEETNPEYFVRVLYMMQSEKLITGLMFVSAWGNTKIIGNQLSDASITSSGIHYLKDNGNMKRLTKLFLSAADIISGLIAMIGLE